MTHHTNCQRILVTGAASGIGSAICEKLRHSGFEPLGVDRIPSEGIRHLDVVSEVGWHELLESTGPVHGLVNCAGIRARGAITETALVDFRNVMETNVTGTFLGIREVSRGWLETGSNGSIVNIGSVVASKGVTHQVAYNASKAALASITRSAAAELGPHGIKVNLVAPGSIQTSMTAAGWSDEEHAARMRKSIPLARAGTPSEIAGVVRFLLSDEASYVNGATWEVDGGWMST